MPVLPDGYTNWLSERNFTDMIFVPVAGDTLNKFSINMIVGYMKKL